MTKLLLEAGAKIQITNNKGSSPLHFLCYTTTTTREESDKSLNHCKILLEYGCDVNSKDMRGATPLLVCCVSGR